ncbi:MAG: tetratricopeptide repeat protein [Chloroherpetonaceae bacterium]
MRFLVGILIFLFSADEPNWSSPSSARLLDEGLEALFNYDLKVAFAKFDSLIILEPNRPEGYALKSTCAFWKFLLSEKEADYDVLVQYADLAHARIEAYLDAHKHNARSKALSTYFLAEHHLQLGAANARRQNFATAAIHFHKAKGLYKDALKFDSTFYDAAKGVGFIEFFSSLIPDSYKWLASVFGYEGTREDAMRKLELARDKGIYTRRECTYYVAMLNYLFYNRYREAESELLSLAAQYPKSVALSYTLGSLYFKYKDVARSEAYLKKAIDDGGNENEFSAYALFRLAELQFRLNQFENAKKSYLRYLSILDLDLYRAQTYYKLGLCSELLGNRQSALAYYKQAVSNTDNPDELYARRKAKELLARPISNAEQKLLLARNHFDAGKHDSALFTLHPLFQQEGSLNADERAEFYYRLARIYDETGKDSDAILFYQKCYGTKAERERYLAPQSRLHLGRLYARKGEIAKAKDEFEKATRYVSFDFEKELRREIKLELAKLEP